jgi:Nitroreductase family
MDDKQPHAASAPGVDPPDDVADRVVQAAVWAPSVHNTQPWRFGAGNGRIDLHADDSRRLAVADPDGREMIISCGAALFTARLALRSLGWIPQTLVFPEQSQPLFVARVTWSRGAAPTELEQQLADQVRQRRTHRGGFDPLPLSAALIRVLREGAKHDQATLRVLADDAARAALATVVQEADQALRSHPLYLRELAAWTAAPGGARRDGVPPESYPPGPDRTYPRFPGRDFAHGHGWGTGVVSAVPPGRSAGLVCLLTTARDTPSDWVNAGQAMQRMLLTAAANGVAAALHSQPLEIARIRDRIRASMCDGSFPQMIIRLGTVIQNAASIRRPASSVLLPGDSQPPRAESRGGARQHGA